MTYRTSRNLLLMVLIIFSFLLIALSTYQRKKGNYDTRSEASTVHPGALLVNNNEELQGIPRIVSLDPKTVIEGEYFTYYLSIVDSDNALEELEVYVLESPLWLHFDTKGLYFFGLPTIGETDTEKVVLQIDDGENLVEHTFYLLILPEDEQDS